MIVVSDTSPIRALGYLDLLWLLPERFERIVVPPLVADELLTSAQQRSNVDVRESPFLTVVAPGRELRATHVRHLLHAADTQVLALALGLGSHIVLMDEKAGRHAAVELELTPVGVLGILLYTKERGQIPAVLPYLNTLESEMRFFISGELRTWVAHQSGEEAPHA